MDALYFDSTPTGGSLNLNTYDKVSMFFNFLAGANDTFYWDDVSLTLPIAPITIELSIDNGNIVEGRRLLLRLLLRVLCHLMRR